MALGRVTVDYAKWTVRIEADGKDSSGKPVRVLADGKIDAPRLVASHAQRNLDSGGREGHLQAHARLNVRGTIGFALGLVAVAMSIAAQAPRPAPRWPDGRVRLGSPSGGSGYWASPSARTLTELNAKNEVAPFMPWAKSLFLYRQRTMFKDDPVARCLPPGGPRSSRCRMAFSSSNSASSAASWCCLAAAIATGGSSIPTAAIGAGGGSRAQLLRQLGRPLGEGHAGRRFDRLQRAVLDHAAAACRTPRRCTSSSASRGRSEHAAYTRSRRRSADRTRGPGPAAGPSVGAERRHPGIFLRGERRIDVRSLKMETT